MKWRSNRSRPGRVKGAASARACGRWDRWRITTVICYRQQTIPAVAGRALAIILDCARLVEAEPAAKSLQAKGYSALGLLLQEAAAFVPAPMRRALIVAFGL